MSFQYVGPSPVVRVSEVRKTTTASITTASVLVSPGDKRRLGFYIWNNSANSVYLSFDTVSTSASPTRILATFATWESVGGICYTGPISAIRNSGSGTVTLWELLA